MRVCKVPSRVGGLAATTELKGITHIVGSEELCIENDDTWPTFACAMLPGH